MILDGKDNRCGCCGAKGCEAVYCGSDLPTFCYVCKVCADSSPRGGSRTPEGPIPPGRGMIISFFLRCDEHPKS